MASFVLPMFLFVLVLTIVSAVPADQKPLDCPQNEEYYRCSPAKCYKVCSDLKNPPGCPGLSGDCYQPSCECISDYLRNSEGKCVPWQEC
nr:venom serine protease inhibitor-like isoform X2 [Helicoverpa armigera]